MQSPTDGHVGGFQNSCKPFQWMNILESSADPLGGILCVLVPAGACGCPGKVTRAESSGEYSSWVTDCLCLKLFKKYISVHFSLQSLSLFPSYLRISFCLFLFLFPREQFVLQFILITEIFCCLCSFLIGMSDELYFPLLHGSFFLCFF